MVEDKSEFTRLNMPKYVSEFEETYFWRKVMLPSLEATIVDAMDRMIYCEDVREIRRLQTLIKTTQLIIGFPRRKHKEAIDDVEFEAEKKAYSDEAMDEVLKQ